MELNIALPELALARGQVVTLDDAAGRRIFARFGTVWVTEEGDGKDYIVGPGDARLVRADGRTVVQALQSAWVSIQ